MAESSQLPIIFLAFANDYSNNETNYLRELRTETRRLQHCLEAAQDRGLCKLILRPDVTVAEFLSVFRQYRDQISVFHFAGHANGYELLLDSGGENVAVADAGGVAAFLAQQRGLRLVFLNACATRDQVKGLLSAGVDVIIATAWDIEDKMATDFATQFYQSLASDATIGAAYEEAQAAIRIDLEGQYRDGYLVDEDTPLDASPWQRHYHPDTRPGPQWKLSYRPEPDRLPHEPPLIEIRDGIFMMGSEDDPPAKPYHEFYLPTYRIGKYPVTNNEYLAFIKGEKRQAQPDGWFLRRPLQGTGDNPVVGVSWYDAQAYCDWLSRISGRTYRLPTEAEWEKAARGIHGQEYPWGPAWKADVCNAGSDGATPVRNPEEQNASHYPRGRSPFGCCDMIGNVEEWTSTLWGNNSFQSDFVYPYDPNDGREDIEASTNGFRIHRGGSFRNFQSDLGCHMRSYDSPNNRLPWRGFRVVQEL